MTFRTLEPDGFADGLVLHKIIFPIERLATVSTGMHILLIVFGINMSGQITFLLNCRPHNVHYSCLESILEAVKHHRRMTVVVEEYI